MALLFLEPVEMYCWWLQVVGAEPLTRAVPQEEMVQQPNQVVRVVIAA